MSSFFDYIEDYFPAFMTLFLWVCFFPMRVFILGLLPAGSSSRWHPLFKIHKFFDFNR